MEAFYFVSLPILLLWMKKRERKNANNSIWNWVFLMVYTQKTWLLFVGWGCLKKWILTCKWVFPQNFYSLTLISKFGKSKNSITLAGKNTNVKRFKTWSQKLFRSGMCIKPIFTIYCFDTMFDTKSGLPEKVLTYIPLLRLNIRQFFKANVSKSWEWSGIADSISNMASKW